ncbi:MAG: phosphoglycerate kinase [Candidatus Kuenenbacteria bacterium]
MQSIKRIGDLKNKCVIVRSDFDVPLGNLSTKTPKHLNTLKVLDNRRLKNLLPTIKYLSKKKAKIILIGHAGRPQGKIVPVLSLMPVRNELEKLLNKKIVLFDIDRYISKDIQKKVNNSDNQIIMLENLRFSDRESANCKRFAKNLASLADIYVNESFANSHRAHASIDAIQKYLPSYMGLHLEEEIKSLSQVIKKFSKPASLIVGGAKTETKIPVIEKFLASAQNILLGGIVANTFLNASGYETGNSKIDKKFIKKARNILIKNQAKIFLPVDVKVKNGKIKSIKEINKMDVILDIGPKTIRNYTEIIKASKSIIWNGPMGYVEDKKFQLGTRAVIKAIFSSKAKSIIGGGDTDQLLKNKKIPKNIFVSSGGGAILECLSGKKLPGIK